MTAKRPKADPIHNPTLFQMEKLEEAGKLASELKVKPGFSIPGILLGTSSFTAKGWEGSFYPKGTRSADYLSFYAEHFDTVEVDSTFYACPCSHGQQLGLPNSRQLHILRQSSAVM